MAVGAEALDVHPSAQALQHLGLGEVRQPLVVGVELVDELLQLVRPRRVRGDMLRHQADQLLWVSLCLKKPKQKKVDVYAPKQVLNSRSLTG